MCKIGFHEKTNGSFILEKNKLAIRKYMQFKAQNMRCSRQSLGEMVIWTWPLEGGITSNNNHQTKRFVFKIPKSVWHGAHPQVIFTLVYHWHPLTIIPFFARKYSHHLAINRGKVIGSGNVQTINDVRKMFRMISLCVSALKTIFQSSCQLPVSAMARSWCARGAWAADLFNAFSRSSKMPWWQPKCSVYFDSWLEKCL